MIHPSFQRFITLHKSASELNDDLGKISYWANHWKMQVNPDPTKQANEVIFSRKTSSNNLSHPPINLTIMTLLNSRIRSTQELF